MSSLNGLCYEADHSSPTLETYESSSIVPFNATLNWGSVATMSSSSWIEERKMSRTQGSKEKPHTTWREEWIISELWRFGCQQLVYRCGFVPTNCWIEGNAVSIAMNNIRSIAREMLFPKGRGNHSLKSETHHTLQGPHYKSKHWALKWQLGAIEESPWDGTHDYLMAGLANP